MKLQVVFGIDPTGMSIDIKETIELNSKTCIYCTHNTNALRDEVQKALEIKGYNTKWYFHLFKVYIL